MPILRLATAIENAQNEDEESVLALLDHLMPTLADWRQGEQFRAEQARLEPLVEPMTAQIQETVRQVDTIKASVLTLESEAKKRKNLGYIVSSVAVVLVAVPWYLSVPPVALVAVVIGIGAGVWLRKKTAKAADRLAAAREELTGAESSLADLYSKQREIEERLACIGAELDARSEGFPEVVLARVGFPLAVQEVVGTNVLIDRSGSHPSVRLQAVDCSEVTGDVREIRTKVQAMSTIPPLLLPGDKPIEDPMTQLYGEESELQDLVTQFTVTLGKLREVAMGLPLVRAGAAPARGRPQDRKPGAAGCVRPRGARPAGPGRTAPRRAADHPRQGLAPGHRQDGRRLARDGQPGDARSRAPRLPAKRPGPQHAGQSRGRRGDLTGALSAVS